MNNAGTVTDKFSVPLATAPTRSASAAPLAPQAQGVSSLHSRVTTPLEWSHWTIVGVGALCSFIGTLVILIAVSPPFLFFREHLYATHQLHIMRLLGCATLSSLLTLAAIAFFCTTK